MYTRRCEIHLWQLSGPDKPSALQKKIKKKKKLDSYFWEKQHHSKNNNNEKQIQK